MKLQAGAGKLWIVKLCNAGVHCLFRKSGKCH